MPRCFNMFCDKEAVIPDFKPSLCSLECALRIATDDTDKFEWCEYGGHWVSWDDYNEDDDICVDCQEEKGEE